MHPKRLEGRILKAMHRANREYQLIQPGDKILVALSGGKDSYALMWGLMKMRAAAPFDLPLVAFHLDQGQPGHDTAPIEGFMKATELPYEIEYQDTYTRVVDMTEEGKVYCSLCSRFRRAILYKAAIRHGCNKVAVGHHRDDIIETLLLNVFYSGQIKGMPPRLVADRGGLELIRPLCYVHEEELVELSEQREFPVVPCNLCGSLETQRQFIKGMLRDLDARSPHIKSNILHSMQKVQLSHLMDKRYNPLYDEASENSLGLEDVVDDDQDVGAANCGEPEDNSGSSLRILS